MDLVLGGLLRDPSLQASAILTAGRDEENPPTHLNLDRHRVSARTFG